MKKHVNDEELKLICQKGFYQYDFIDSQEKLSYGGLPPKEAFYSKVRLEGIKDEDYKQAQSVYN